MSRSEPLRNAVVEDDPTWVLLTAEGAYREVDVSVDEETWRRMWEGYMCAYCFQPWEEAFPSRCTMQGCWSGDITEASQRTYMREHFGGEKWVGPSRSTVASWDNAIDKHGQKPKGDSTIWVPGDPL